MLWFHLLQLQRRRHRTGFTFPFLIGAIRYVQRGAESTGDDFGDLCDLLMDMQQRTSRDHYVGVAYCGQVLQPIAAIYSRDVPPSTYKLLPIASSSSVTALYASAEYNRDGAIDAMASRLWDLVGSHIERHNYSVVDRAHVPFTAQDMSDIERARRVA